MKPEYPVTETPGTVGKGHRPSLKFPPRTTPTKRIGATLAIAISAAVMLAGNAGQSMANIADLELTDVPVSVAKQARTIKLINYLIDKSHYRKLPLDNDFSEQVLEAYLDQLDAGKSIFLESDIKEFNKLRYEFDDYIRDGTLNPAFAIFSIFRARVDQRVEYALDRLSRPFDFKLDEEYLFDREEATWASSAEELDELWRKRIKNDILNLRLSDKDEDELIDTLKRRYTHLARRTRQFKSDDVFQTFINAYVNTIEPHTSYFSPRATENFKIHMRLSLEGIGAVLQTDNEYTLVRRIVPGGPADMADELQAEDRITGVAQGDEEIVDVVGWRLDDVVELIRGPKESIVRLEILPGKEGLDGQSRIITIKRDKINLEEQAAKKRILNVETDNSKSKIGVIDLPSFYIDFDGMHKQLPDYRSTTRDVKELLKEFQSDGIDGLVIDLRGNGGGALTEAISLTGLFIRKGPVVQVKNSSGRIQVDRDPDPEIIYDGPLMVLVDRYSASASEIFAGAIQDYRRGLIVGEPTFGKGTVQNLVNLNRFAKNDGDLGQLKVTIAQFFRINGDSTQHRGVIPDLIWPNAEIETESGERAYENAIPWHQIKGTAFQYFQELPKPDALEKTRKFHEQRIMDDPEFQYFMEIKRINEERRSKTHVTLNEEDRTQARKDRDKQRLDLENRKRLALGQDTVRSIKLLDEELEKISKEAEDNKMEQDPDFFLRESGSFLSDYLFVTTSGANQDTAIVKQGKAVQSELLSN